MSHPPAAAAGPGSARPGAGRATRPAVALNGKWLAQQTTGTQRYADQLARRLVVRDDLDVTLHLPRGAAAPAWLPSSVPVVRSRLSGVAFEQLALPWASRRRLVLSLCGPAPMLARRQVATIHDATPFRYPGTYTRAFGWWHRSISRVLARRAQALVTVSEFSAAELADVLHRPRASVHVVPNGSDHLEGIVPTDPGLPGIGAGPAAPPFALAVGTLAAHKNLAPALHALHARGIPTVVVGARGAGRVFAEASAALPPEGIVRYAGRLTDAQLGWLYRHAAVLVFPSRYEGFGVPLVEAQRLGCPVVATTAASLPEVAGAGAILVDPDRPDELAESVAELLASPHLRATLAALGRANAERYTWDRSANLLGAVLIEAAGEPASGWCRRPPRVR